MAKQTISREPGSRMWEPEEVHWAPLPLGARVSPQTLQALGQQEELGLGVRPLDFCFVFNFLLVFFFYFCSWLCY